MKVLLDENVPVSLARRLAAEGLEVEHPILTRQRGLPDRWFFDRVENEEGLVFPTHDEDFSSIRAGVAGQVVISRVRQSRPPAERLDLWSNALRSLRDSPLPERLFDLDDDG